MEGPQSFVHSQSLGVGDVADIEAFCPSLGTDFHKGFIDWDSRITVAQMRFQGRLPGSPIAFDDCDLCSTGDNVSVAKDQCRDRSLESIQRDCRPEAIISP
jgi:hypothetical protein